MALRIQTDPPNITELEVNADRTGLYTFELEFTATEDDPLLAQRLIAGNFQWGDTPERNFFANFIPDSEKPYVIQFGAGIVTVKSRRQFKPGLYIIKIRANNFREPTADTDLYTIQLTVVGPAVPEPVPKTVYGPILPLDSGFPNKNQWNLNLGTDQDVLISSIKMILLTSKGERETEPNFGTNIRTRIFDPYSDDVQTLIQQDIQQAIAVYEPRVQLINLNIVKDPANPRTAILECNFKNVLTNELVSTLIPFTD